MKDRDYLKGCLVIVGVVISIPFLLFIWIVTFPEEPATHEEISAIMNQELENEHSIHTYSELVDFLNRNKKEIVDSLPKKDTSNCFAIPLSFQLSDGYKLPMHLSAVCNKITSELVKSGSIDATICRNGAITLSVFKKDYEKYLYIYHKFYIDDCLKRENCTGYHERKLIRGKYHYLVRVEDAFNYMDPNNFAPN